MFDPFEMETTVFYRPAFFLILLPVLDLLGILYFSSGAFGLLLTLGTTILTAFIGLFLVRRQGFRCWAELNACLDHGDSPAVPLMNGALILLAGLLILTPGMFTDLIGLLLMVPPIRTLVVVHVRLRFESYRMQSRWRPAPHPADAADVIDVD